MFRTTAGLSGFGVGAMVGGVVMGLRMYSFIDVMIDCLNCVPSVALKSAAFNPSWHLTPITLLVPHSRLTDWAARLSFCLGHIARYEYQSRICDTINDCFVWL